MKTYQTGQLPRLIRVFAWRTGHFVCFVMRWLIFLQEKIFMQQTNFKRKFGPGHAKMCLMPYANNKGTDQPAYRRSLISTFVVCCLDSMLCMLAISKHSGF